MILVQSSIGYDIDWALNNTTSGSTFLTKEDTEGTEKLAFAKCNVHMIGSNIYRWNVGSIDGVFSSWTRMAFRQIARSPLLQR